MHVLLLAERFGSYRVASCIFDNFIFEQCRKLIDFSLFGQFDGVNNISFRQRNSAFDDCQQVVEDRFNDIVFFAFYENLSAARNEFYIKLFLDAAQKNVVDAKQLAGNIRSEERRVGKEGRSRWTA